MNDGIIVVQIEPNKTLKVLTLSASPEEAIRQIAQIMEYPSDDPLSTGNLAALYSRDQLFPGGHFRTHRLKLYNVYHPGEINALTPQDATLIWHNSTTREEMPVNFMASNVQRREKGPSILGRAVLSGFDLDTVTIRSVPLRVLERDLAMEAYTKESGYLRTWREARGL